MKKWTLSSVAVLGLFLIGTLIYQGSHLSPEEVVLYDIMEEWSTEDVSAEETNTANEEIEDTEEEVLEGTSEEKQPEEEVVEETPTEETPENAEPINEHWFQTANSSDTNRYIIYADDLTYPQGCNTVGLDDPLNNCVLAIPLGTGYLYVAPGSTDQPKINSVAPIYCLNLDLGESDWYLPDLNDPSQRLALYDTKSKLNNFVAGGASKANHYWTSWWRPATSATNTNCTLTAGNCGSESSSTETLWVRCVTTTEPQFWVPFSIDYSPKTPTTWTVLATLTLHETGTLIFADPLGRTTTDNRIFTKTYTDNLTGELITFQNTSGDTKIDSINITWIIPGTTIHYSPVGPALTTGSVTATVSFNRSWITITNNGGSNTYIFTEKGSFPFEWKNDYGNTGAVLANVDWIGDGISIVPIITYTPEWPTPTTGSVIATISFNKNWMTITNNEGNSNYVFHSNKTFTFTYKDKYGTTWSATATVDWISNPPDTRRTWKASAGQNKCFYRGTTDTIIIDWGDGTPAQPMAWGWGSTCHSYSTAGEYEVQLSEPENLEYLEIYNQQVTSFWWGMATHLRELYLYYNQITTLSPWAFDQLASLRHLYLDSNQITYLPLEIFNWLTNLQSLSLAQNQIKTLPAGVFANLSNLREINIYENYLTSIPDDALAGVDLSNMWWLGIEYNCLNHTTIPSDLANLLDSRYGRGYWENNQYLCPKISYNPATPTNTNVQATVGFWGNQDYLSNFVSANAEIETGHLFTGNGEYLFDYSAMNNASYLKIQTITGEVTWIDKEPPVVIAEDRDTSPENVIVAITLDKPAKVTTPGRTLKPSGLPEEAENEAKGLGTLREKTYTENAKEEVLFQDALGNEGNTIIEVTTITSSSASAWGGNSLEKDYCPEGDFSPSYYDKKCEAEAEHNAPDEEDSKTLYETAYERAKEYGITTASTYEDTRISDTILRQEMAKMISTYAIKLLNKIPDTSKVACAQFQDVSEVPAELQPYIIQSCELGLMGMHGDGIQVQDNFFPKSFISRAEVGTILSRLLRGTTYATQEGDETYYSRHLQALKKAGIMNFISNPDMLELRGNILLMLWKSVTK